MAKKEKQLFLKKKVGDKLEEERTHVYTERLAQREDMVVVDEKGKEVKDAPKIEMPKSFREENPGNENFVKKNNAKAEAEGGLQSSDEEQPEEPVEESAPADEPAQKEEPKTEPQEKKDDSEVSATE